MNFVRDDDCNWLFSLRSSMYTDIPNEVARFVYSFKTFESDVLIEDARGGFSW